MKRQRRVQASLPAWQNKSVILAKEETEVDLCLFKASLIYVVSSMPARAS